LFLVIIGVPLFLLGCPAAVVLADANGLQEDSQIKIKTTLRGVTESDIGRVRKEAGKGLHAIPLILGFEFKEKIIIEIVDNGICRTTPDEHIIFLPLWHIKNRRAAIIHEVSHAIVRRHENSSFFSEGLAEFFQVKFGEDTAGAAYYGEPLHLSLDDLVIKHRDNLIPLADLKNNNDVYLPIDQEKRKLAYIEAGSFVNFLYEIHGERKLQDLYGSETLNYERVYGKNVEELEVEWLKFVVREQSLKVSGAD